KGEFFAVRSRVMWSEIVRREERGMYTNVDLLRSTRTGRDGTTTEGGSGRLERPMQDWNGGGAAGLQHPAVVSLYEVYVELLPKEWGLGASSFPEKWVFTITTDKDVLIGAMPLGAVHGAFPIDVLSSE